MQRKEARPGRAPNMTDLFLDAVITVPANRGRYPAGLQGRTPWLLLLRWRWWWWWRRRRLQLLLVLLLLLQLYMLLQISHLFLFTLLLLLCNLDTCLIPSNERKELERSC